MGLPTAVIEPAELPVEPGSTATFDLRIAHGGDGPAEFRFEVVGPAKAWGAVSPPRLTVAPGREGTARLAFHPPRSPQAEPGTVPFQVRVVPGGDQAGAVLVEGVVEVGAFVELTAAVSSPREPGARAVHKLTVENRGNVATRVTISATSPDRALAVRLEPATAELAPGASVDVNLRARVRRGGRRRAHRVEIIVRPDATDVAASPVTVDASLPGAAPTRRRPRVIVLAMAAGVIATLVAVVVRQGGDDAPARAAGARNAVGLRTETFVDTSRPTLAHGGQPRRPERTLTTVILYPAAGAAAATPAEGAPPARDAGPYPMIVFAHGSNGEVMTRYGDLLRAWAAAGYVVAAPTFPFARVPDDVSNDDYPNQPADMSFVTSELLRLNGDQASELRGLVDPGRIGAAGSALGGITVYGLVASTCCRDARFRAAAVFAASQAPFGDSAYTRAGQPPLLVVHGDRDTTIPYADARQAWFESARPKHMVTILGGDHGSPFLGPIDDVQTRIVRDTTTAFFDHYLRGAGGALDRLDRHGNVDGVAKLESEA